MSSAGIQDGGATRTELTRIVENDDLGVGRSGLIDRVILGVGGDVSAADILD